MYTRSTPLTEVIKEIGEAAATTTVADIARDRSANPFYGKVLMACETDQLRFLFCLYEDFTPDDDVKTVFLGAIRAGLFLTLLDKDSNGATDLIKALDFAVQTTKARMTLEPHVCSRCRRQRR